uniref:Uncharacterized protein n=1 Tax=Graphocephala atropunctata TaxID=36148 RepID=A0A1B6LBR0_9HEMI
MGMTILSAHYAHNITTGAIKSLREYRLNLIRQPYLTVPYWTHFIPRSATKIQNLLADQIHPMCLTGRHFPSPLPYNGARKRLLPASMLCMHQHKSQKKEEETLSMNAQTVE